MVQAVRDLGATNPVVLIDGRSGAGKSTLARELVARWPIRGRVQLVALDNLYPGLGRSRGRRRGIAASLILHPHARGLIGVWQRWDWDAEGHAEAHAVDPSLPLIVEGSGLLTPATREARRHPGLAGVAARVAQASRARRATATPIVRTGIAGRSRRSVTSRVTILESHATHLFAVP